MELLLQHWWVGEYGSGAKRDLDGVHFQQKLAASVEFQIVRLISANEYQ
jgi:hypothetical protein